MPREINLVPDIKNEMLKTLKLRNLIFFVCFIVAIASGAVTLFFGTIMVGQQAAVNGKASTIDKLSEKLNSYDNLDNFLTIRDQLNNIASLTNNKKMLSRTFNILSTILPNATYSSSNDTMSSFTEETNGDTATISAINISLADPAPTYSFDAQIAAGKLNRYNNWSALEAFKKSMSYMRYDYGNYVDKNGEVIPAYCIVETDENGAFFSDSSKGLYAFWTINDEGCDPSKNTTETNTDSENSESDSETSTNNKTPNYVMDEYNGKQVVRIWRTPQYSDWYKQSDSDSEQSYMSLDGKISNIEHFESACITYQGELTANSTVPKWKATNETCWLVPGGEKNGITISDSSDGRDTTTGNVVLRFAATIALDPAVYKFNNHHMIAIGPKGYIQVTGSYRQIGSLFGERAADICKENDPSCNQSGGGGSVIDEGGEE